MVILGVTKILYLANIKDVIEWRIKNLVEAGLLLIPSSRLIVLCLLGDKGAKFFKLGIMLANAKKPNHPANFTLVALYKGIYWALNQN